MYRPQSMSMSSDIYMCTFLLYFLFHSFLHFKYRVSMCQSRLCTADYAYVYILHKDVTTVYTIDLSYV
jgi:hypothetical protein